MSKAWQLGSGSLVAGHLLAVIIQTRAIFYATEEKGVRKQLNKKFLE